MKRILITGPSGSGKTYLARYFKQNGLNAIDADLVYRLGEYYDSRGNIVEFPEGGGAEFLDNHSFLWDEQVLKNLLKEQTSDLYLFGGAGNLSEFLNFFDINYYLDIPSDVIEQRLASEDRSNPGNMGKTEEQRRIIVEYVARVQRPEALKQKLTFIDGTKTPQELIEIIASGNKF